MRVSLHRRRHESLPPQKRRSPKIIVILIVLTTGTMAFAATRIGGKPTPEASPGGSSAESTAEQATRDVVNERLHAHLKRLSRD